MSNKPQLQTLKGFRDFLPQEKRLRDEVIDKIKKVFELYGFEPIETPTLEYASVLQGKYGEEADKLMYTFKDKGDREVGLRYDQTVPTARFLAQHQHELTKFPKRYQIQNVFRAENTQAGRYREFLQMDCDIFGTKSNLVDAEILAVFYYSYIALGLSDFIISLNDRQQLVELINPFETAVVSTKSIIQTIDKLDKIGRDGVIDDLIKKGLNAEKAEELLNKLKETTPSDNLKKIMALSIELGVPEKAIKYEPTLARGLDYYTGIIFEGKDSEYKSGSLGGGGRYDDLISQLGGPNISAVGFAIGFDRTLELLKSKKLISTDLSITSALVTIFDESVVKHSLKTANLLRKAGINTEIYPEFEKLGKQLKYASDRNIEYVIIIGPEEILQGKIKVKNLSTQIEEIMLINDFINRLKNKIKLPHLI
jgi:histidyl-tRNA synthetase